MRIRRLFGQEKAFTMGKIILDSHALHDPYVKEADMKKLMMFSLVAVVLATNANAAIIPTTTTDLGTIGLGTHAFGFENSAKTPTAFTDSLDFTLSVAGQVKDILDFNPLTHTGLHISLFDNTTSSSVFDCLSNCGATQNFGNLLLNDSYSLTLSGLNNGLGGDFRELEGKLKITTAVPEASSLAMMFAGAGLLLTYSLRRRRSELESPRF